MKFKYNPRTGTMDAVKPDQEGEHMTQQHERLMERIGQQIVEELRKLTEINATLSRNLVELHKLTGINDKLEKINATLEVFIEDAVDEYLADEPLEAEHQN